MAARATPERDAQVAVIRWLRLVLPKGSIVASAVNEQKGASPDPMARARFGAARKASGVVTGWPDLTITIPGGRVVFLEMKAPRTGVLSVEQQAIHTQLRSIGHHVGVAEDIETARGVMLAAGVHLNEPADEMVRVAKVRMERDRRLPSDMVPF